MYLRSFSEKIANQLFTTLESVPHLLKMSSLCLLLLKLSDLSFAILFSNGREVRDIATVRRELCPVEVNDICDYLCV